MKWYFAVSESSLHFASHDWPELIQAAVTSAQQNTSLAPHFLYDGDPNTLTAWLERRGVKIIYHRVSFFEALARYSGEQGYDSGWLQMAAGAFLRIDIPYIEKDDNLVLYTDCDVIFQPGFTFSDVPLPKFFSAAAETGTDAKTDMNSGVMLINIPAMRAAVNQCRVNCLYIVGDPVAQVVW